MTQRENLMSNFKIFLKNENKITAYQKVCDTAKSVEVYTALSAYNKKKTLQLIT